MPRDSPFVSSRLRPGRLKSFRGCLAPTTSAASAVSSEEEADDTDAASAWGGLCQFTSMLHPKGRVLWEMFAWAHPQLGNETVLLECDTAVLPLLQKRLRMFKLRAAGPPPAADFKGIFPKPSLTAVIGGLCAQWS